MIGLSFAASRGIAVSETLISASRPVAAAAAVLPARSRLDGVDAVRGIVMVLMALDHVRDFLQTEPYRATDLNTTTPALFLSRLVTHLCARRSFSWPGPAFF